MSLTGKTLAGSYKDILQVDNSNSGIDEGSRLVKDGEGTSSCMSLSDDVLVIRPQNDDTTSTFGVRAFGGAEVLTVDTTNELVKASGNTVNTQYAHFGHGVGATSGNLAGYHYPLYFGGSFNLGLAPMGDQVNHFGNGTDPATTFTTAAATDQFASNLIGYMWYVPDAMSIDSVSSMEGADAATGDTTRFHLMSYTFTSGSTSCLTSGALVAHNSDTTNAGSEQIYLSNWTVDSAAITAGKVLICTFESDSVFSDYAYTVTVKYHLT
tara:strand:+ start:1212 stop:2012 length:801 start_codon:yes stop_codon:yes gene_type:complete